MHNIDGLDFRLSSVHVISKKIVSDPACEAMRAVLIGEGLEDFAGTSAPRVFFRVPRPSNPSAAPSL